MGRSNEHHGEARQFVRPRSPTSGPSWSSRMGAETGVDGHAGVGGEPRGSGVRADPAGGARKRSEAVIEGKRRRDPLADILDGGRVTETERWAVLRELTDLAAG